MRGVFRTFGKSGYGSTELIGQGVYTVSGKL